MTAVFSPLWQPCQCRHINAMSIFPLSILFISLLLSCLKTRSGCQPTYTKSIASFAFCARLEIDESLKTSNVYCQIGLSADAFPNEKRVIFHLLTTMKWRILSTWESSPPLSAWKKKRERVCRIVGFFCVCTPRWCKWKAFWPDLASEDGTFSRTSDSPCRRWPVANRKAQPRESAVLQCQIYLSAWTKPGLNLFVPTCHSGWTKFSPRSSDSQLELCVLAEPTFDRGLSSPTPVKVLKVHRLTKTCSFYFYFYYILYFVYS